MQDRFDMPSALAKGANGRLTARLWPQLVRQGWQLVAVLPPNQVKLARNTWQDAIIYDVVECEPLLYARFAKQLEKRAKAEEFLTAWIQQRERQRRQWREYYHRRKAAKKQQGR